MDRFAIAIVGHPARAKPALELVERVGAEAVTWDDTGIGCAENHLRAMEWLEGSDAEWAVILEDDAVPVLGFRRQLSAALAACPTPVCSLYLGTGRPPHWQPSVAQMEGAHRLGVSPDVPWFTAPELLHGVGYAVRRELLWSLRRVVRRRVTKNGEPVDEAVSAWLKARGAECSYSRPSLVDHADTPTLLAEHPTRHKGDPDRVGRAEVRRAWRVGCRDVWSPDSLPLPPPVIKRKRRKK